MPSFFRTYARPFIAPVTGATLAAVAAAPLTSLKYFTQLSEGEKNVLSCAWKAFLRNTFRRVGKPIANTAIESVVGKTSPFWTAVASGVLIDLAAMNIEKQEKAASSKLTINPNHARSFYKYFASIVGPRAAIFSPLYLLGDSLLKPTVERGLSLASIDPQKRAEYTRTITPVFSGVVGAFLTNPLDNLCSRYYFHFCKLSTAQPQKTGEEVARESIRVACKDL